MYRSCQPKSDVVAGSGLSTRAAHVLLLIIFLLRIPLSAQPPSTGAAPVPPKELLQQGTDRMVSHLDYLAKNPDLRFNSFLNDRRAAMIRAIPEPAATPEKVRYLLMLGNEELLAGESQKAAETLERVQGLLDSEGTTFDEATAANVARLAALSHLRLGEQENCVVQHNIDRCLLPIREGGVHTLRAGSTAAIAAYSKILEQDPDNLGARWLLNLAHMTLGTHPDGVPKPWLIPPAAFESEADIGRFVDRAPAVGLDVFGLAGGSVLEDFDRDGDLDLMVSAWGLTEQLRLFENEGDGTFSERTREAGLEGLFGGLNLVQADYDNDGFIDVLVLRGAWLRQQGNHPNSLLRNNGDGTWSDVSEIAGVLSFHPTQTAAWADYDNDGWVDLFIGNESVPGSTHPAELFHNDGDGTFTNVAAEAGVAVEAYIKGVVWGDIDNDGLIDLYVSNISAPNRLFHNRGRGTDGRWHFDDVTEKAGVAEPVASFPTWFWDYDNDGFEDLFVSGYRATIDDIAAEFLGQPFDAERPRLYHNNGDGTFTDVARTIGLDRVLYTMGSNFGDLDNDGFLDFYVGTGDTELQTLMPNRMFRNDGGRRFQEVTSSGGFGHLQKGHGISFGDIDQDGDQDIYAVMGGAHSGDGFHNALFENPGHGHHWLVLELEGVTANRAAIGARVRVVVEDANGKREIHRTVTSGGSFGASPLRVEIGLGDAQAIERVTLRWPGNSRPQELQGLELDRFFRVRQGEGAKRVGRPPFKLGERAATESHSHPDR